MDTDQDDPVARFEALDRVLAERRVRPPGIALMIVGGLWIASGVAAIAGGAILFAIERDSTDWSKNIAMIIVAFAVAFGAFASATGVIAIVGGRQLHQLGSRRWAIAGSLTAILPGAIALALCVWGMLSGAFGCFAVGLLASFFLGVPIGIWALIVLRDDIVKAALR